MTQVNRLQTFTKNKQGRDFVVGDIHGCYTKLMQKLDEINFDFKKDRLFSVGDLIDRGPENEQCLELIYENWFFPVMGNHELLMMNAIFNRKSALWFRNGGQWILTSDLLTDEIALYAQEINLLVPFAIEITDGEKKIGIVHAEPSHDWNIVRDFCQKEYDVKDILKGHTINKREAITFYRMTWGRTRHKINIQTVVKNIDQVIVGHTINENPINLGNVRYIDTGCFYTDNITVEELNFNF